MLETLNIPKGGYVIFTAAGSALSRMGIHLAKHIGLKTIAIVRRDEQREELLEHGATAVISSASEDIVARIKEITGGEVLLLMLCAYENIYAYTCYRCSTTLLALLLPLAELLLPLAELLLLMICHHNETMKVHCTDMS
jgi:NADPH:quinone reductase-like Zn-dependent oxidoreductase